jgi:hypothetical protein
MYLYCQSLYQIPGPKKSLREDITTLPGQMEMKRIMINEEEEALDYHEIDVNEKNKKKSIGKKLKQWRGKH